MKKIILVLFIVSLSVTSFAGSHSDKKMDKLINKLELNEQQSDQVKTIMDSKSDQRKALHQQMKQLQDQTNSEIEAILTPEQLEKFQQFQQKRKAKMEQHRGNKSHGGS